MRGLRSRAAGRQGHPGDLAGEASELHLFAVTFNEPRFVPVQHELLARHLRDPFVYGIVDNSSNAEAAATISRYCSSNALEYIRIEANPYSGEDPSRSHAFALNALFGRVLGDPRIRHFGVLDHDVFPFAPTSLLQRLAAQGLFGLQQVRDEPRFLGLGHSRRVYLWPGFMFFDRTLFGTDRVDCMPDAHGDTASRLGHYLSGGAGPTVFASQEQRRLFARGSAQSDLVEVVDDNWLHLINGSNWAEVEDMEEKIQLVFEMLRGLGCPRE